MTSRHDLDDTGAELTTEPQDVAQVGETLSRRRRDAGLTQEELAERSQVSVSAIRAIERGARGGRIRTLQRLARALGVRTSDLMAPARGAAVQGEQPPDALLPIRRALYPPLGLDLTTDQPASPDSWDSTLRYAERLYAEDKYDDVLGAVPVLLEEAQAIRTADPTNTLPAAQAYLYAAQVLTQVRQLDLANHALGKAMEIAHASSDELLAAWTVTIQCWTLLLQRRFPEVEQLAIETAGGIEPRMSETSPLKVATWGWLMVRASAAAVRDARVDDAEEYMRMARTAATGLNDASRSERWMPPPVAGFCAATVGFKEVENAVLLGDHGKALELADRILPSTIPTANNRHRHQLDIAASQLALHKPSDAIEQLLDVREQAPEWIRHQGYARGLIADLVEARRRAYADEVGLLADHIGIRL
ncbi:helix-turn-helix domain-containing protein [Kribbella sp. NPDC059898]|uniref:helix-turn-helix domain-containing protein n=1 Tax=Kribbella sp. NPDC059898 TaxID=3346995 RepID=UPI0036552439